MAKLPRLDEVFLVSHKQLINVGPAYSRKKAEAVRSGSAIKALFASRRSRGRRLSEGDLKPEFQDIARKHAEKLAEELGVDDVDTILSCMEDMMHEVEGAEGEDPAELDQDGPEAGSTGEK